MFVLFFTGGPLINLLTQLTAANDIVGLSHLWIVVLCLNVYEPTPTRIRIRYLYTFSTTKLSHHLMRVPLILTTNIERRVFDHAIALMTVSQDIGVAAGSCAARFVGADLGVGELMLENFLVHICPSFSN